MIFPHVVFKTISATASRILAAMCSGFLALLSISRRAAQHQLDTPLFLFLPGDRESRISAAKKLSAADNFL
jgi:hypothetical protein